MGRDQAFQSLNLVFPTKVIAGMWDVTLNMRDVQEMDIFRGLEVKVPAKVHSKPKTCMKVRKW